MNPNPNPAALLLHPYYYHHHLARAVVAARDEAVARLVEGAVGERQDVRSQDLEEVDVPQSLLAPWALGVDCSDVESKLRL